MNAKNRANYTAYTPCNLDIEFYTIFSLYSWNRIFFRSLPLFSHFNRHLIWFDVFLSASRILSSTSSSIFVQFLRLIFKQFCRNKPKIELIFFLLLHSTGSRDRRHETNRITFHMQKLKMCSGTLTKRIPNDKFNRNCIFAMWNMKCAYVCVRWWTWFAAREP